jgi:hypothetical protein
MIADKRFNPAIHSEPQTVVNLTQNNYLMVEAARRIYGDTPLPPAPVRKALPEATAAQSSCLSSSIIAMPISGQLCLMQFNHQASPELASKDLPFVAIGSGQFCADPFLAFIRRLFWPDRLPHLSEGKFAAYWTLDHAIKTSPGGITEPKQIAVLETVEGKPACRELTKEEIDPIELAVTEAESRLKAITKPSANAEDIPKPEKPSTQSPHPAPRAEKS